MKSQSPIDSPSPIKSRTSLLSPSPMDFLGFEESPSPIKSQNSVKQKRKCVTNKKRKFYFQSDNESDVENYDVINRKAPRNFANKKRHVEESESSTDDEHESQGENKNKHGELSNYKSLKLSKAVNVTVTIENHKKSWWVNKQSVSMDSSGHITDIKPNHSISSNSQSKNVELDDSVMDDVLSCSFATYQKYTRESQSRNEKENLSNRTKNKKQQKTKESLFPRINSSIKASVLQCSSHDNKERKQLRPKPVLRNLSPEMLSSFQAPSKSKIEWHTSPLNNAKEPRKNPRKLHDFSSLSINSGDMFSMFDKDNNEFDNEISPSVCKRQSTQNFFMGRPKQTPMKTYSSKLASKLSKRKLTPYAKPNVSTERRYDVLKFTGDDNFLTPTTKRNSRSSATTSTPVGTSTQSRSISNVRSTLRMKC